MIILDTDVLIEIFDKNSEFGDAALKRIVDQGEQFFITSINLHEILYGLLKYAKPIKNVADLPVLSYSKEDAELSSELEIKLERKGKPTKRMDAMIAAISINHNAKLYTNNTKDFKPFTEFGLKLL